MYMYIVLDSRSYLCIVCGNTSKESPPLDAWQVATGYWAACPHRPVVVGAIHWARARIASMSWSGRKPGIENITLSHRKPTTHNRQQIHWIRNFKKMSSAGLDSGTKMQLRTLLILTLLIQGKIPVCCTWSHMPPCFASDNIVLKRSTAKRA